MHELSLVRSLLAQVSQIASDHGGGGVREICVQCGPLSGVEPALMLSAFESLRDDANWLRTALRIEEVPLQATCEACRHTFEPERFRFACPRCGSAQTRATSGEGVILESITLEEEDVCPA